MREKMLVRLRIQPGESVGGLDYRTPDGTLRTLDVEDARQVAPEDFRFTVWCDQEWLEYLDQLMQKTRG
jgi:hypothetical protein